MAVAAQLKPTYPLAFAGHTFPGYSAFYTLVLNLFLAVVLTLLFNALGSRSEVTDDTLASDYHS